MTNIVPKIESALLELHEKDKILLDNKMEWATAHRLAVYMENLFPEWNIDCEYNKMDSSFDTKHDSHNNYRRPDIVIHKRGEINKESNLLVIEIKMNEDNVEDEAKLVDFTRQPNQNSPFQYQYGLKIWFHEGAFGTKWFKDGHEIN